MDALDLLIAQTLKDRWGNCRPPARAWGEIHRRVVAHLLWHNAPIEEYRWGQRDVRAQSLLSTFPTPGSFLWRYDLVVLRFA